MKKITNFKLATAHTWRLLLCALVLTGLTFTGAKAQTTVTIGTGTTTTTQFPIYAYYGYSYTQSLYLSSEIGFPSGGTISTIRFFMSGAATPVANFNNWTVYLGNTSLTSLTAGSANYIAASAMTQKFTGTVTFPAAGNWMTITLSSPFTYTGGNLIVAVDENAPSYSGSNTCTWRYTATAATRSTLLYSDSYNPDPNALPGAYSGSSTSLAGYPNIQLVVTASSACSGTPAPGNTTSSVSSVCSGVNFTLGLQNPTNGSGVSYQWQSSPDNSSWTNFGTSASTQVITQSAATYYRSNVTCSAGPTTTASNSILVGLTTGIGCVSYCVGTTTNGCASGDQITNVTFSALTNPVNNTTGACISGGSYSDYTSSVTAPTVTQGDVVSVSVTVNNGGTEYAGGWIDYNQSGTFTSGEFIALTDADGVAPWIYNGTASIPAGATVGTTRMRFRSSYSATIASTSACDNYSYGETEDYYINIAATVVCSGTPAPGNTTSSATSVCSGITFTLGLQNTIIGSGITYQWQSSPNNSTWTNFGTSSSTQSVTQSSATYYRCNVSCSAGGTGSSNSILVNQNPYTACYCIPGTVYGCAQSDVIARVVLNTLDNNSGIGCPSDPDPLTGNFDNSTYNGPGYTDYTGNGALTTTLQAGTSYNCTVYSGDYAEGYAAWIDYNDDGLFNNVTERIGNSSGILAASSSTTFTISLACNPPVGVHRLRVRCMWNLAGASVTPCDANSYGEVEDYLVTVAAPPPCPTPSLLAASNVTGTTVDLSWTAGCVETAWDVEYGIPGHTAGTGTIVSAGSSSYTLTIPCGSTSQIYVRANCGGGNGVSAWFGPVSATTAICPCSGTPAPGNTVSSAPSGCSTQSITLSLQNNPNQTQLSYQWQTSPDGSTWTNAGTNSSTYVVTQAAATWYQCIVTCTNGGASATSTPLLVTQSVCYCTTPVYSYNSQGYACANSYDYIDNFTFAGINNTSGCNSASPPYYIYFGSLTANVLQTVSYPVSISAPAVGAYFQRFKIYIDFNDNGSFDDAGELLYDSGPISTATNSASGNIAFSASAPLGTHRLRVRSHNGLASNYDANSCSDDGYIGEVEDYNVTIGPAPACSGTPNPGVTIVSNPLACSSTTINLSLQNVTPGLGVTYQWQSSSDAAFTSPTLLGTGTTEAATQSASTYYRCEVTCAGSTTTSTATLVTSTTPCYCTNPVTGSDGCGLGLFIDNFTFAGINNTSGCYNSVPYSTPYYSYFNGTTGSVVQNQTYPVSITSTYNSGSYYQSFGMWIDFNNNGSFEDAGEKVLASTSGNSTTTPSLTGNITIPLTAPAGNHLVRIRSGNVDGSTTVLNSCSVNSVSGETEDYVVNIIPLTPCSGTPVAGTASSSASTICGSASTTLSLSGNTQNQSGYSYQWQESVNSGAYSDITGATTESYSLSSFAVSGSYTFRCVVTCANGGVSSNSVPTSAVMVYAAAFITPGTIGLCDGNSAVVSAYPNGADSYQWSGAASDATQQITVTSSGTYVVTVSQGGGTCITTSSADAVVTSLPTVTASSDAPVCQGSAVNLTATGVITQPSVVNYSVSPIGYSHITPVSPTTVFAAGSGWDDAYSSSIPLPFSFNFYGTSYNSLTVATNGYVQFDGTQTTSYGQIIPNAADPNSRICGVHNDLVSGTTGSISYFTSGIAPNRVFVMEFLNCGTYGATSNYSSQIDIFESGGIIEVHVAEANGSASDGSGKTIGVENADGTLASFPAARNGANGSWDILSGSPEGYRFSPASSAVSYAWTGPNTFNVQNPTISNASVSDAGTYSVVFTDPFGCTSLPGTTNVAVNTVSVAPTVLNTSSPSICTGGSTTLSQTGGSIGTGAFWQWYDENNITVGSPISLDQTASLAVSPSVTTTYHLRSEGGAAPCDLTVENVGLTVTVIVNPTPSVVATPSSASTCSGTAPSISLSGGATYSWTGTPDAGTAIGTGNNGDPSTGTSSTISEVLTNSSSSAAGQVIYSVSTVSAAGCPSASNTLIVVDVNPSPTATVTDANNQVISGETFCNGGTTDLHLGSSISGTTFAWSSTLSGNPYSSGTANPIQESIPNNGTSDVTVIYTITPSANGCDGAPVTATEVVEAKPVGTNATAFACSGYSSSISLTTSLGSNTGYTWNSSASSSVSYNNVSGSGSPILDTYTNTSGSLGTVTYTVSPYSLLGTLGCAGDDFTLTVSVGSIPLSPVTIAGPAVVCQVSTATYSIAAVSNATSYVWTVPGGLINNIYQGMTITSQNDGGLNPSITVSITAGTVIGDITVTAINGCVDGLHPANAPATLHITKKPAVPGAISGPTSVCGVTSTTYSIAPVFGATSYAWTLPTGMTVVGSSTGTSISVNVATTYAYGQVKVSAINACGNIPGTALTVYGTPVAPVSITGPTNVCGMSSATYTSSASSGAISYGWVLPAGMTVGGLSTFTTTGTTINPTIVGNVSGTLKVRANSPCGSSTYRAITIVTTAPATGAITGPSNICGSTTATYSIAAVAGATGYQWTLSSGLTGASTGTSITVTIGASVINGTVKVAAVNACGIVGTQTNKNLSRYVTPGAITGSTTPCINTTTTYTITRQTGVTYIWSAVGGTVGTQVLTSTTSSISVTWNGTAGAGSVKVNGTNACGQGPDITYAVTKASCASPIAVDNNSEVAKAQFNLYPNPTSVDFTMDVTTEMDQDLVIEVYDVLGNKVISEKHSVTAGVTSLKTNIENFKNGMYFVRVVDGNSNTLYTQTVTKQ